MWNEINNQTDLTEFMDMMGHFHDSCIKEMSYYSGAFVDDVGMYTESDCRVLKLAIQTLNDECPMIEMAFEELDCLNLNPYTGDIFQASMFIKDNLIYWCDDGWVNENNLDSFKGTIICAKKLKWRPVKNCMGDSLYYKDSFKEN